uniref:Uncharacterized protein n=1 Tax=Anguilla anguilla TaxID=7936 RepID=A0A0E9VHT1_ANGAN
MPWQAQSEALQEWLSATVLQKTLKVTVTVKTVSLKLI